ncbi:hypothetical protein SHKM778_77750 [Streptomyces sp. KM77-8]|uniref:Uncharacterized protein n=1 Tax=Streptomyces haneummycinicus TaxID=3074435 RepID=A0AAT9HVX8_9ACTN
MVEEPGTGFCGAVIRCEAGTVTLEDRFGKHRVFPLEPRGFLLEGRVVTLVRPSAAAPVRPARTASGSVAVPGARARVARAGRIYVEGRHDAELVEKVWGDDLRIEGVVVEYLSGVDDLPSIVADFAPAPTRGWASWWTIWCRARRSGGSRRPSRASTRWWWGIRTSTSGRR